MTRDEIKAVLITLLSEVAPEADAADLDESISFRDQLDIDSMDFLNLMIAIDKAFGIAVTEADYPKLASLKGCIDYISNRLADV